MNLLQELLHIAADNLPVWRDLGLLFFSGLLILSLYVLSTLWEGTK